MFRDQTIHGETNLYGLTWRYIRGVCARISKHKRATQNEYRSGALGRGFRSENYSGSGRIMDYKWWIALKLEYVTSVNVLFPL